MAISPSQVGFQADAKPDPSDAANAVLAVVEKMQQRRVEQRGVLQEGEMAGVGQDQQSGARDRGSDIFGVRALDRLVVVAVRHRHWRSD